MTNPLSAYIDPPITLSHFNRKKHKPHKDNNAHVSSTSDSVTIGSQQGQTPAVTPDIIQSLPADLDNAQSDGNKRTEESGAINDAREVSNGSGGYDEQFLGKYVTVPLPRMTGAAQEKVLHFGRNGETVRNYTHFSLIMNKERKMVFLTATNIDGETLRSDVKRGKWQIDEVIGAANQLDDSVYEGNSLDRGHMCRRRDVVWGPKKVATRASDETFYYPNAVPQHADLNQKTWHDLENWLLDHANKEKRRLSVFTGPVFGQNDLEYRGVNIPGQFWKIVVLERESDHKLAAAGFIMSQEDLLKHMNKTGKSNYNGASGEIVPTETVAPYQVSLSEIEKLTSIDFGELKDVDAYALFKEDKRAGAAAPTYSTLLMSETGEAVFPELSRRFINSARDIII